MGGVIQGIIGASLRFRVLAVATAATLLGLAVLQLPDAAVDALPEFTPPRVEVQAEALGLSAAEVEQLITVPLEQDLLNGVPWLDTITSESVPGLSTIDMVFEPGTELIKARQMVQEHLLQAHALPQVGTPPVMIQPLSATSRVMMIGLGARDLSLLDLSILARWKIKPRLMGVPGVANVAVWGQRDRQLQVQVDPARLAQYGVTLSQVIDTTGNALWVSPLTFVEASTPGTGGFIDTANQRFAIQHVLPITTATDLAAVSVQDTGGRRLLLGQVADVVEDHQPLIGDAVLDGSPGLMLVVQKFPDADVLAVSNAVAEAMAEMSPGLTGVSVDTEVFRPAAYLDTAINNLGRWALIGLLLFAAALLLLLFSWRSALIAVTALVLSIAVTVWVLHLLGATLNLIVLTGLVAALPILIDDAVHNAEQLRRRVHERVNIAADAEGGNPDRWAARLDVVLHTLVQRRRGLVYATLIVVIVPLPALALTGVTGALIRPLVGSYLLAVGISTVVALMVSPALTLLLSSEPVSSATVSTAPVSTAPVSTAPVSSAPLSPTAVKAPVVRRNPLRSTVDAGFNRLTRGSLHGGRVFGTLAVLTVALVALVPLLRTHDDALPTLQDRNVLVHWAAAPGTSLTEMSRITAAAGAQLRALAGVQQVGSHLGRALMADQSSNVNSGELWVTMNEGVDYAGTLLDIQQVVAGYPGIRAELDTYTSDQVRQTGSADTHDPLVVRVYGHDLDELSATAERVRSVLAGVEGVQATSVQSMVREPTVQVRVDLIAAQKYGVTPGDVRRATATYYAGLPVGSLYEQQKIFDVVVWGTPEVRSSPTTIGDLAIELSTGGSVRLRDVATVTVGASPAAIAHDNISRSLDVTASVSGDLSAVTQQAAEDVGKLSMPAEFHAEVLAAPLQQVAGDWRLAGLFAALVIGVLLLLQAAFGSWRLAGLALLLVPVAASGGVLAAALVGGGWISTFAGLLAVLALAVRSVVTVLQRLQVADRDGAPAATVDEPGREVAIVAATRDAFGALLIPVVALICLLAALLMVGMGAGTELILPMAVVVSGGAVTALICALLVLPGLYLRVAPVDPS